MANDVVIGAERYGYSRRCTEDEILAMRPEPPQFEDEIEDVEAQVAAKIGKVTMLKFPERAHGPIRALLEADEERRQKQLNSRYSPYWDKPLFDDPFEKRRLRILNAIFTKFAMSGMKPSISGPHARDLDVRVNDTSVSFSLDATSQKSNPEPHRAIDTRGSSKKLKFQISTRQLSADEHLVWEDQDSHRLEKDLTSIVVALIVAGERQYRAGRQYRFERLVERKARLIEEIKRREEEARRLAEEHRIQTEQARIDRLLAEANSLRQAREIRDYVAAVRQRHMAQDEGMPTDNLETWASWALAQAERIDPVEGSRFMESMNDEEPG